MNALETVTKLRDKIDKRNFNNSNYYYEYALIDMIEYINVRIYLDEIEVKINLWNSEEDYREFDDGINEYESFESFLTRQLNTAIKSLQTLKKLSK